MAEDRGGDGLMLVSTSWSNSESFDSGVRKSREWSGTRRYYLFNTTVLKWIPMGCTFIQSVSLFTRSHRQSTPSSPSIILIVKTRSVVWFRLNPHYKVRVCVSSCALVYRRVDWCVVCWRRLLRLTRRLRWDAFKAPLWMRLMQCLIVSCRRHLEVAVSRR